MLWRPKSKSGTVLAGDNFIGSTMKSFRLKMGASRGDVPITGTHCVNRKSQSNPYILRLKATWQSLMGNGHSAIHSICTVTHVPASCLTQSSLTGTMAFQILATLAICLRRTSDNCFNCLGIVGDKKFINAFV